MAEEEQVFYTALGKAITQWQSVEDALSIIFTTLLSARPLPDLTVSAAFHTILNFRAKLDMTSAAFEMKAFLGAADRPPGVMDAMFEAWTPLKNRAHKRSLRRNELAHFAMSVDDRKKPGYRYTLRPSLVDMRALMQHGGNPPERNICSIIAQGNSFQKLGLDLMEFYLNRLGPFAGSPPSPSPEQSGNSLRKLIQTESIPTDEGHSLRPEPSEE
jgi:hypothetical protein